MAELERTISFTYRVQDQISEPSKQAADSQRQLKDQVNDTNRSVDSQRISFVAQVAAVSAMHRGVTAMNNGLQELGILSGSSAIAMNKLNAIVQVTAGTFNLFKGATQMVKMLTAAEVGLASVQSFRAVLNNPAKVALVATGLGVAGGIGGYFLGKGSGGSTQVSQTVNINGSGMAPSDYRSISRDSLEVMGG